MVILDTSTKRLGGYYNTASKAVYGEVAAMKREEVVTPFRTIMLNPE